MLLEAREKPILSCFEHIRKYFMKRLKLQLSHAGRWHGEIRDRMHKILERNKLQSGWCHPIANGFSKAWDISGIPCPHAVVAIYHERGDPMDYVHHYYKKEAMLKAYSFEHIPLSDQKEWAKTRLVPIKAPLTRRQPGRPKRLRKREPNEPARNPNKLKRYNVKIFCKKCKQEGHNSRTCERRKQKVDKNKKNAAEKGFPTSPPCKRFKRLASKRTPKKSCRRILQKGQANSSPTN
ncbi:hypothetical protein UlMin_025308 [Ulmus minor]